MSRNTYKKLEEDSEGSKNSQSSNIEKDFEISQQISQHFLEKKKGGRDDELQKEIKARQNVQRKKLTEVRSIYMDNFTQVTKIQMQKKNQKTHSNEEKINTDQLIKVLQNGKQRRNMRKKKIEGDINMKQQQLIEEQQKNQAKANNSTGAMTRPRKSEKKDEDTMKVRKVIAQMKNQNQKQKIKQERQWQQLESMLTNQSSIESPRKQRNDRRNQLEAAKQLLTGKVSIIWIFVIKKDLSEIDEKRIKKMYSGLSERNYIVPLCKNQLQANQFLTIPNSLFKVVSDLDNISNVLRFKINPKVVQFYIYNQEGEKGISKALCYKAESRKVKGIFNVLEKIIDRAQQQIENQIQMFMAKNGLSMRKHMKKFPSFLKLSGQDKTYATLYRANLYGARNLPKQEKKQKYEQFMAFVHEKYGQEAHEKNNIIDYKKLRHLIQRMQIIDAKQVIKFYVRQSFYYQIINSMLRTMKTTEQFKPCVFPFYENYHSIKMLYLNDLNQQKRTISAQTLYRGAKIRLRDFQSLKPNNFIEMFGFMSTSKKLDRAKQFSDRDGYIFVIHVPQIVIPKKYDKYDHGFVDINKHKLASKQFEVEEEVLFNALNVFKINKIEQKDGFKMIHIQYGAIFSLLFKEKQKLTADQNDILINYQYCTNMLEGIQDQGDVYLLANQYDQSKQYYADKIKTGADNGKYYYKLANVQQQCGQLQEADSNVKKSLELQLQTLDMNDRQRCLKVFSIHTKNAEISLDKEDYLDADEAITNALEFLSDEDYFQRAKYLRERGQIKFKKGQIKKAEKDFAQSQYYFKKLTQKAEDEKKKINRGYVFSFLTLICSSTTQQQIDKDRQQKLQQIAEIEQQIKNMNDVINEELIKVNNSLKQVAHYVDDKENYQICVRKARGYLVQIQSRQTNDPRQKAKLKALQATIKDYLDLAESQKLLQQAIDLVQSSEPFDPTVGKYSTILANLQKQELQKFSSSKGLQKLSLEKGMQPIKYNQAQQKNIYNKCKKNYEKALNILLYNSKTNSSPQVMNLKNQLGQLDFNQSNYANSEKIIKEVKQSRNENEHSQVSKSCLLLSKISYARGQLKDSFENVEESNDILKKALIKKQEKKYFQIYEKHEIYRQLMMHRSKIYMRQLNHDLSLKDIHFIQKIMKDKMDDSQSHCIMADLYEMEAQNILAMNGDEDFQKLFMKAIKLRERQMGSYNLPNAVTYCNYAKYMILAQDFKEAEILLGKALQIFSCFSEDHPITWLVLYCSGIFNERKNKVSQSIKILEKCLKMAKKKFDRDHITINKIRFQFGNILHKAGQYDSAIRQFQQLQNDLEEGLNGSRSRNQIKCQKDDEKITMKRSLYNSLRNSYQEINKADQNNLHRSKIGLSRIQLKISDLRKTYIFDEIDQKLE